MTKLKNKSKHRITLLLLALALLLASLSLLRNFKPRSKSEAQSVPPVTTGPDLYLAIPSAASSPAGADTVYTGQNLDVQVYLKTGSNEVRSLDILLPYDDGKLTFQNTLDLVQNIELNPSSGFDTQISIRKVDTVAKRVIVALASPVANLTPIPVQSNTDIHLATIKFRVRPDAPLGVVELIPDISSTTYSPQNQNILSCRGGYKVLVVAAPTPTVTPAQNPAGLKFSLQFPDVTASIIPFPEVRVEIRDGASLIGVDSANLVKAGSYYQTLSPVFFNVSQNKTYTLVVKTSTSLRRQFTGVNLAPAQTLDCTVTSNSACGTLISQRDLNLLYSGDSDGFNEQSGSYNKVDSADLQALSVHFNSAATGAAVAADFNIDGQVDISDLEILGKNYGKTGD